MGVNRAQRRAQWRTRFRKNAGDKRGGGASEKPSSAGVPDRSTVRSVRVPGRASVQLRIEELLLRGFERGRESAIANGVQSALARMLAERGVPEGWVRVRSFEQAKAVVLRAGQKSHSIGEHLAQAVFELPGGGGK